MQINDLDPHLSLGLGLMAYTRRDGDERVVIWPTEMDERQVVETLVDVLVADDVTAEWPREVVANLGSRSVQDFMETEGSVLENNAGVVRFNAGSHPEGFSVIAVIDDGVRELQGIFAADQDAIAAKVIKATIVASSLHRVDEIVHLGRGALS